MNQFLRLVLMVGVYFIALSENVVADPLSDAFRAYEAKNYSKAAKLYKPLAQKGDASAQMWLGMLYYDGDGVKQDDVEAMKWLRLSAAQGKSTSQYLIGKMYMDGRGGVTYDALEAIKWFRLAAEQGLVGAQLELGDWYGMGGWLAYIGEGRCQNCKDYPKEYSDPIESLKWYRLAANQNNSVAQYEVGRAYHLGHVVPLDYVEAVKWYRLAAEQGYAFAHKILGECYAEGEGVPQDYVLAYMWTNIAAVHANSNEVAKLFKNRESIVVYRDSLAAKMTTQQIGEAQQMSRVCAGKNYKGC